MMSKLLVLEMHVSTLPFLGHMHARLLALLGEHDPKASAYCTSTPKSPVCLLFLPLPMMHSLADAVLLTPISTYLMHAIISFTRISTSSSSSTIITADSFPTALAESGSLLTWVPYFVSLPRKHVGTTLTRAYTMLTK
ncbi:hypothetical protein P692DRAFT_20875245 [Suillus brevipes Sb2]|nr:hypothetical protein P692DRAFT_20875245 [Suillus brevipes Sb2]